MKAFGLARIGRDAEIRHTAGGDAVASLSLAFTYGRKGEDGKRPTQWVDASLWGKRAEALAQYLTKGSPAMVEGRLKLDQWEDKQSGQKRSKLKVVLDNVQFLSTRGGSAGGTGGQSGLTPGRSGR